MNREKKVIHFGEVATNGALVVRKAGAGRELIPVPLGERFTIGLKGRRKISAIGAEGQALGAVKAEERAGWTWFEAAPEAGKYVAD
jgi:hypothetical protein